MITLMVKVVSETCSAHYVILGFYVINLGFKLHVYGDQNNESLVDFALIL